MAGILAAGAVHAATATGTLNVSITITAECVVNSASNLDFGSHGVLAANVDNTATVNIQCTNTLPYNIGLAAGGGSGATTTIRRMTGPASATINYSIYRDAGRTLNWGNSVGSDTLAGTGTGASVPITIYGRIPPQTTPAAGAYADTVNITVTY